MKKIIFTLILSSILFSCATSNVEENQTSSISKQKEIKKEEKMVNIDDLVKSNSNYYTKKGELYSGKIVAYKDFKTIVDLDYLTTVEEIEGAKLVVNSKEGKLEGEAEIVVNDKKIYKFVFKNGKLNGELLIYNLNGNIGAKGLYKDGKLSGESILYYENGNVEAKEFYKDGKLNGEKITYYENGNIESKLFYIAGKLNGEEATYYESGNIETNLFLKDGELSGESISYYESGNIEAKEYYKNGKLNGEKLTYYESGNVKAKASYKDDKLTGEGITYYKNGNIEIKEYYKDGKLTGEKISYYENGNVEVKGFYIEGKLNGITTYYIDSDNKNISRIFSFLNDIQNPNQAYGLTDDFGDLTGEFMIVNNTNEDNDFKIAEFSNKKYSIGFLNKKDIDSIKKVDYKFDDESVKTINIEIAYKNSVVAIVTSEFLRKLRTCSKLKIILPLKDGKGNISNEVVTYDLKGFSEVFNEVFVKNPYKK